MLLVKRLLYGGAFPMCALLSGLLGVYLLIININARTRLTDLTLFFYYTGTGWSIMGVWWLAAVVLFRVSWYRSLTEKLRWRTIGTGTAWAMLVALLVLQGVIYADCSGLW